MVIETPPKVLGVIDDAWFQYVAGFGNAGPDKGQGGKFLPLPPGYEGDLPEGYHVARSNTYGNWVVWLGFQVNGSTTPAVEANADGSYDIYFGPKPPQGMENNWIQSVPGKDWNTIFRLYGPLQAFYDKTWKPSDPELVE